MVETTLDAVMADPCFNEEEEDCLSDGRT
ncbi:TbRIF4-like protein, partial [Diplonema papillatum]